MGGPADGPFCPTWPANATGTIARTDHLRIMGLAEAAVLNLRVRCWLPGGTFSLQGFLQGGNRGPFVDTAQA